MSLSQPIESRRLDCVHIGRQVLRFERLESTNSTAAALADSHEPGLVVIADYQTAGRGQYGRVWEARSGSSLLMSVALRPPRELCRPVILTALAAVAVGDAILALTGVQSRIKWPNDLLACGKKVCGILIESTTTTAIGIGLNLNQTAAEFAAAGLTEAGSLEEIAERPIPVWSAAEIVIQKLDLEFARLLRGEIVALEAEWKWRVGLLGRQVALELN
ncbi:MAG TPA: biotin--[acetyl-CoA-carboxylase] ligase, partial [Gemmata sp.]|nr:biotin--[acetyl-CoA-carboxylase] ligase [Gemmata sp.]